MKGKPVFCRVPPPKVTNPCPIVQFLFLHAYRQYLTDKNMGKKAGINPNTLTSWKTKTNPRVKDMRACLEVIGFELVVIPIDRHRTWDAEKTTKKQSKR